MVDGGDGIVFLVVVPAAAAIGGGGGSGSSRAVRVVVLGATLLGRWLPPYRPK